MRKRCSLLCQVMSCIVMLSCILVGCTGKESTKEENVEEAHVVDSKTNDFATHSGSSMTVTPEGYYVINRDFLYYITPDFQKSTIVCNKPNCIHNERDVENEYVYNECDAYFFGCRSIRYYDGYLYITSLNTQQSEIYQISIDGSERRLIYESPYGPIDLFSVYCGEAYIFEVIYTDRDKTQILSAFSLDNPNEVKELFRTSEHPTGSPNGLRFYGEYCYFNIYTGIHEVNGGYTKFSNPYKVHLETGEVKPLYRNENSRYAWNDYGVFVEVMDFITYVPEQWTSRYYRVLPDSENEIQLTEKEFAAIASNDIFYNMDDKYIYFGTINNGVDAVPWEQARMKVYDYDGNLMAEIPSGEFGDLFYVLPGTDDYMFVQKVNQDISYDFYYVEKAAFDGGVVEAHRIEIAERG